MRNVILLFFIVFLFICCRSGKNSEELFISQQMSEIEDEKQKEDAASNRAHIISVINGRDTILTSSFVQNGVITSAMPVDDVNPFIGYWNFTDESTLGSFNEPASMFSVKLAKISDVEIKGNYSAIALYGDKIDSDPEDNENWADDSFFCRIKGILSHNELQISFNTSWNGIEGEAIITLIDEKHIKWKLIKWPHTKKGYGVTEYWGPTEVILTRIDKS